MPEEFLPDYMELDADGSGIILENKGNKGSLLKIRADHAQDPNGSQ